MTGRKTRIFNRLEFYYSDLSEKAKREYLEFYGVDKPSELNKDVNIFPIFELVAIEE